jgi:replication-associated recombination protein RarA
MAKYTRSGSDFAEDRLPPGQKPIETSNVRRFITFMELITDSQKRYSTMGVVTGPAGIGKTVSIQAYLDNLEPRAHTGLPGSIKVTVKPRSTPKALAVDTVDSLRDKPRGRNSYELADEAAAAIVRNALELLIIDEADRLNEDSFELLRHLFDKTGCPIVVVGLPRILGVIDRHEKFASRVGLRMDFLPLEQDEILNVVLPGLVFERWEFDPSSETDRQMGERIWKMVNPSLRKLRNLLQIASQIAKAYDQPRVTLSTVNEAFSWSATKEDRRRFAQGVELEEDIDQPDPQPGEFERESERRHDGKQRRRHKRE